MVSSLKNCLRQKGGHPPRVPEESELAAAQPSQSKTTRRRRRDTSAQKRPQQSARESHQRALAASSCTLEERIERLSQSITRGQPDAHAHSQSCNLQRRRSQGWNRRDCRSLLEDSPVHSPEHSPPKWGPGAWEDKGAELPLLEFDPGPPPELGSDVNRFLQEPASSARKDCRSNSSPELPLDRNTEGGVTWQGQVLDMPDWWQELAEIAEIDNYQELDQRIQAFFELHWQNEVAA